jgi:pimeloyl-ACP methyl ester carboxylesterase
MSSSGPPTGRSPSFQEWSAAAVPIQSGGLAIAGHDVGSGRPVTFLHGYPSSSLDFEPTLRHLGPGWRGLAVDFPGFGASAKPPGHAYSIHAAADSVEAMWRVTGVTDTVLVAHDYGVSVGQELLARRRDGTLPVELTATVWSNGGLYPELHRPTVGQQMLLDPEHGAEVAAAIDEALFAASLRITWGTRMEMSDGLIHEIWESMARDGGTRIAHELLHYIADRRRHEVRWRDALEQCDLPMRFVWGDLDPVSGAHMIEAVEARIPSAVVTRFGDVGHWPPLEAPDEVAAAITASA